MGPGFRFGNDCFVGPNVTICNDRWPSAHKADFDYEELRRRVSVIVCNGASIGANAVVLPGVMICKDAMIAAGAVVIRDVPENHLLKRNGSLVEIEPEWRKHRMDFC